MSPNLPAFSKKDLERINNLLDTISATTGQPTEILQADYLKSILQTAMKYHPTSSGCFVTLTRLKNNQASGRRIEAIGVSETLGYSDSSFNLMDKFKIIPRIYQILVEQYGLQAYQVFHTQKDLIGRIISTSSSNIVPELAYCINYPSRTYDNELVRIEQVSKVCQIDETGNIISNLNICYVHQFDPMIPIVTSPVLTLTPYRKGRFDEELQQLTQAIISEAVRNVLSSIERMQGKPFLSRKEAWIAKLMLRGLTSGQIATEVGDPKPLSKSTVDTHRQNIKSKISIWFPGEYGFITSTDVVKMVKFANSMNLLDPLLPPGYNIPE